MSNAERQKRYRERKKEKEGEEYLKREVQRVKRYYVPTTELSDRSLSKRRKKIRQCMRKHRQGKKSTQHRQQDQNETEMRSNEEPGPCDSTTDREVPSTSTPGQPFFVKMNFNEKKRKRRTNKSLSRANKKIKTLDMKVKTLNTRNATLRKKVQRLNRKLNKSSSRVDTIRNPQPSTDTETGVPSTTTPKSRAITEVNQLNMTPRSRKKVRQKLLFQNCLVGDTEEAAQRLKGKAKIRTTLGVICGKLIH